MLDTIKRSINSHALFLKVSVRLITHIKGRWELGDKAYITIQGDGGPVILRATPLCWSALMATLLLYIRPGRLLVFNPHCLANPAHAMTVKSRDELGTRDDWVPKLDALKIN